jgi:hypothetical protein
MGFAKGLISAKIDVWLNSFPFPVLPRPSYSRDKRLNSD